MSEIIVYHGGTEKVESPVCKFGRRNLDYGQGFYVTDIRKQAADWATQVADRRKEAPIINRYRLNRDAILREARCKVFVAYDKDWLQFIVASRRGEQVADNYDYIEGGVANDRVVDTVLPPRKPCNYSTKARPVPTSMTNPQACTSMETCMLPTSLCVKKSMRCNKVAQYMTELPSKELLPAAQRP